MAPIKLEEHIREQFEEREISPSAGAWDKLEAKLDKEEGRKRPLFIWYAIAASIVGIIFIASQFYSNNDIQDGQELVEETMETPRIETPTSSEILNTETQLAQETVAIEKPESKQKSTNEKVTKRSVAPVKNEQEIIYNEVNTQRLAVQKNDSPSLQNVSESTNKDGVFNDKVDEVVGAIRKIKQERNAVTATEIDQLLLEAQRDLATQRILTEVKIDATALLNDVEFELEKTFRDKVFDALGDSFSKIRTAVVKRNN